MSNNKPTKKDQLLKRSRTLVDRKKIASLSDFQDIPAASKEAPKENIEDKKDMREEVGKDQEMESGREPDVFVRTKAHKDGQKSLKKPMKTARQNFRFTEELALALENCSEDRRLKKNTVVEIALEQYLKTEGYLDV